MAQSYYLYLLTLAPHYHDPANWTDSDNQIITDHAQFLDDLGKAGILLFAGRTLFEPGHPDLFGIAVIKAGSLEQAHQILAPDPATLNGIQQGRIFPYSLGIQHPGNFPQPG